MPTVHREAGMRFIIYVDDHPPPHVHVEGKGGRAKIAIDDAVLVWQRGFTRSDMKIALDAVKVRQSERMRSWTNTHG